MKKLRKIPKLCQMIGLDELFLEKNTLSSIRREWRMAEKSHWRLSRQFQEVHTVHYLRSLTNHGKSDH